jgi:hypothetical protein
MGTMAIFICTTTLVADDSGSDGTGPVDRVAWRYRQNDLTVTIVHQGDKRWLAQRSDGKSPLYNEISRTADYVEIQNQETKLIVRLHATQAKWRRPKDADWTAWVKGAWVEPANVAEAPQRDPPAGPVSLPAAPPVGAAQIRLAYFVPRDRKPVGEYERKIRNIVSIVAEFYRQDLRAKGYKTEGLQFETGKGAEPLIHLVKGDREATYYNNAPRYDANVQWTRLVPEIRAKVGDPERQVIVVFTETCDEGPAEHLWPGVIARGAYNSAEGGLAIYSAHLLRDELCAANVEAQKQLMFDTTPLRGRKAWGHKMDSPRGEFVEDGMGAVIHELGHALGLPHDRRDDARDVMGNGFRNLRWNFAEQLRKPAQSAKRATFSEENARLLMSSRSLAHDLQLTDTQPAKVEVSAPAMHQGSWVVSVTASDDTGLRAIVFVDRNAGTVVAGKKLTGTKQTLRQTLPRDPKFPELQLMVIVTDEGGHQTRVLTD